MSILTSDCILWADTLFAEILGSNDPEKIQEFLGNSEYKVHGTAEEQVLYPAVRPYYTHRNIRPD